MRTKTPPLAADEPSSAAGKRVGLRDVATLAGVSTATVSRTLQKPATVHPKTQKRVLDAITTLGYTPNALARALSRGRTNVLGLFVPDILNPFYAQVAQGLEDRAASAGYYSLIASSHFRPDRQRHQLASLQDGTIAGLAITIAQADSDIVDAIQNSVRPVVFIDRQPPGVDRPIVHTDSRRASRDAVKLLISRGHRAIAIITGPESFQTANERLRGYTDALSAANIRPRSAHVVRGVLEESGGYEAMTNLIHQRLPPTAVFCFNNLVAVGALKAIDAAGLTIPDDISFISFDDMPLFPLTQPPITAIYQNGYEIGRTAADMLIKQIANEPVPKDVIVKSALINRASIASITALPQRNSARRETSRSRLNRP